MRFIASFPILLFLLLAMLGSAPVLAEQGCNWAITATAPDSRYTLHVDGTVTDGITGLMWQRCAEGASGADCTGGAAGTYTWQEALRLAQASGFAGYADWRLPNIKELSSLVERRCYTPAVNRTAFPNTPSNWFWSASLLAYNSDLARNLFFFDGYDYYSNKNDAYHVRLVRDGQSSDLLSLSVSLTGSGRVTSADGQIACPGACTASYAAATPVTLTAIPDAGWQFAGWGGVCATAGTAPTCTVIMDAAKDVAASFTSGQRYSLSVSILGTGLLQSIPSGIYCYTGPACPPILRCRPSSICTANFDNGTEITLTARSEMGVPFPPPWTWGGDCSGTGGDCRVIMDQARTVLVDFESSTRQTLTVTATGAGTVTGTGIDCPNNDCSENLTTGTTVILTATPSSGATFAGWSGACSGTATTCAVTMDAARNVTASFSAVGTTPVLTLNVAGPGAVSSNPTGIACGSACQATFTPGQQVTLTAMPLLGGAVFSAWGGACASATGLTCTVTMSQAHTVSATFRYPQTNAQLVVSVVGQGRAASNPPGVICAAGATCVGSFTGGTPVTLTATPDSGWQFKEWQRGGACGGSAATDCPLTLDQSQAAVAVFEQQLAPSARVIDAIVVGQGQLVSAPPGIDCGRAGSDAAALTGACSATFDASAEVSFTATAAAGATFAGWGGLCAAQGVNPTCTVASADLQAARQNAQVVASFGPIARETSTRWRVAEVYMATMGYAMDAEGLAYWVNNIDRLGWTIEGVAQSFFDNSLVQLRYPSTMNNGEFIDEIYRNVFGRGADVDGRNYWLAELERGTPRDAMIITVINGGWGNQSADAQADMLRFKHRAETALAFADYQTAHGIVYSLMPFADQTYLIATGTNVLASVTQDTATRDAAIANIPTLLGTLLGPLATQ